MAALGLLATACSSPCCVVDGEPIALRAGPEGALMAGVVEGDASRASATGPRGWALIDTGSPVSLWRRAAGTGASIARHTFSLTSLEAQRSVTRAVFRGVPMAEVPLAIPTVGNADGAELPGAVLAGDALAAFSVAFDFAAPAMTLWNRQSAGDGYLSRWGYAVLRLGRYGGGELDVRGLPDFLGVRGPYEFPGTRLVARACAAPQPFVVTADLPARCCRGDEFALATGTDLALLVGTGTGPLVLSRAAWSRVLAGLQTRGEPAPASLGSAPLYVPASSRDVMAERFVLPALSVVDQESPDSRDPGPCVELGRARRLEQVDFRQAANPDVAACAQPCDQDPSVRGRAQNSAAHLDLTGAIATAVVADEEPLLQAIRAEVRPEGPEVDGIIGAAALAAARVRAELDYRSQPTRAIVSCGTAAASDAGAGDAVTCRAVGRCPRLPGAGQTHQCFGLAEHGLPKMCDNDTPTCE